MPWTRSIVCPVLYTHEVVNQALLRRFLTSLLAAGYQPPPGQRQRRDVRLGRFTPRAASSLRLTTAAQSILECSAGAHGHVDSGSFFALPGFNDGFTATWARPSCRLWATLGSKSRRTPQPPQLATAGAQQLSAFFAEVQDCKGILEGITGRPWTNLAYRTALTI